MSHKLDILILEDRREDAEHSVATLESAGYECNWERVETRTDFVERIGARKYDLILSDYTLPQYSGVSACQTLLENDIDAPFILVSGTVGEEAAVESLRAGASDYVSKDNLFRLPFVVDRALKQREDDRIRRRRDELIKLQAIALRSAANAIVITDVKGTITWVNPAFTILTGYTAEEALGRNPNILRSGKHGVRFYKNLWETVLSGKVWRGEMVNRRKDGSAYVEEQTITPVVNDLGEITNFVAIKLDVTRSREAQELITQNGRQMREILDNISGCVVLLDTKGVVLEVNMAPLEAAGIRREELIGTEFANAYSWNYSPETQAYIRDVIRRAANGETVSDEFRPRMAQDVIIDAFGTFSPLRDTRGRVVKVIGSGYDITRRKRDDAERKVTFNIIQGALSTPNLKEFYKLVHREISQIVYAENCFVMLNDPATNINHFEFWVDQHDPPPPPHLADRGFSNYVLRTGTPLLLTKDLSDEMIASGEAERIGAESPSWIGAPLRTSSGVIGVLVLQHYENDNAYQERDLEFLTSVGDQIALAIDRRTAQEAMSRSEERYRELVENAHDMIYTQDLDGNYTSVNKAVEEILGYTVEEALTMNMADIIAPEHLSIAKRMISEKLEGLEATTSELDVFTSDGRRISVDVKARLIMHNGEPVGIQGIARDVTSRRRGEEILAAANTRAIKDYEALLDRVASLALALGNARELSVIYNALLDFARVSVPVDGLLVSLLDAEKDVTTATYIWRDGREFDVSGLPSLPLTDSQAGLAVATGDVVIANDYQAAIRDLPRGDLGPQAGPALPKSSLAVPMKVMGRIAGGVEVQSNEPAAYTAEHATAMQMAANLAANAIENVRLLQIEAERAEQLRHSQRLESIGMLAGGIAHDFNNLLTVINGYSEMLARSLAPDDTKRKPVDAIQMAGQRASSLTSQLLAFSRKAIVQPVPVDLNAAVQNVEKMLSRLIGEDVELTLKVDENIFPIMIDPSQLDQVIINLAVNGRDAMPDGGMLKVETFTATLDKQYLRHHPNAKEGNYVVLAVTDTGEGIPPEVRRRIFEPFFTTKRHDKGTGLGLATVHGIVEQAGGHIEVYSELGKGTSFKVYFPELNGAEAGDAENGQLKLEFQGTETVLIVEDEEMVRDLAARTLREFGYKTLIACDAAQAQEVAARNGQIDLLFTDVIMPGSSGPELAALMTDRQPGLKVLFASGYTDDAVARRGILAARTNFLQKPYTSMDLRKKIREILDQKA